LTDSDVSGLVTPPCTLCELLFSRLRKAKPQIYIRQGFVDRSEASFVIFPSFRVLPSGPFSSFHFVLCIPYQVT